MASVLRQLQAEWNALVPRAQALGVRRVRLLNAPLEKISYRRAKLEWLKAQLGTDASFDSWTFGVELECILPRSWTRQQLADKVKATGLDCRVETLNHATRTWWKVVPDGSVPGGAEVVSPVLRGEGGFEQLRKVCKVLTDASATVNLKCGLHVHVGSGSKDVPFFKRLVRTYAHAESAIDSFMAPSRRGSQSHFAQSLRNRLRDSALEAAGTVREVAAAIGQDVSYPRGSGRYCKLSLQNFMVTGTVEFRQHQGTVEGAKVINWVKFCLRLCAAADVPDKQVDMDQDLEKLLCVIDAEATEKQFFMGRAAEFKERTQR